MKNFTHSIFKLSFIALMIFYPVSVVFAQGEVLPVFQKGMEGNAKEVITVYTAKKVITMEENIQDATAIAVRGKSILAVGTPAQVKAVLGDQPFTMDETLASKVILPGFIDQHLHPILGALTLSTEVIAPEDWILHNKSFKAASTPEEYIKRLKSAEATIKDKKEWLFTWGYHKLWHGEVTRKTLDEISKTRPIMIWQRSCHEFILNTAAINELKLTEASMQGKGDATKMMNWENGHWWETGTNLIIAPLLTVFVTQERLEAGLIQMVGYLHSKGITAYNEPGALITPEIWKMYQHILGDARTPMYSYFIVDGRGYIDKGIPVEKAIADGEKIVSENSTGKVAFFPKQIKLFADGAIISQLMQMNDGYYDKAGKPDPAHKGEWMITPENLEARGKAYWDSGYQLHIHVNGDKGLDVVLDMLERRMAENPRYDHRAVIVHFANSTDAQVERIARLGALVSANSYYTVGFADKYGEVGLGKQRADVMVRSGSVLKNNIPLSFHSDLPMAPADPLFLAWCAANRLTPSGRVAAPEQKIGVYDALKAITIEAAYSWRKEKEIGSIAPGKTANFTILDEDPLTTDVKKLKDIEVWGTIFEGNIYPVKKEATAWMPDAKTNSEGFNLTGFPMPPCYNDFTNEDEHDHEHNHASCGACSFNSVLKQSGVLNTIHFTENK